MEKIENIINLNENADFCKAVLNFRSVDDLNKIPRLLNDLNNGAGKEVSAGKCQDTAKAVCVLLGALKCCSRILASGTDEEKQKATRFILLTTDEGRQSLGLPPRIKNNIVKITEDKQ